MGDIANILGVQAKVALSASETAQAILAGPNPIPENKKKMKKPKGMSREVFDLMGPGGLVPAIESAKVGAGFKDKRVSVTKGKWLWAGFKNSARGDNCVLHHWQKADVQYADYPYAKFNIRSTPLTPLYTDEEYTLLLQSDDWTRSETDHLMYVVYKHDLRWPVIVDRYNSVPPRCTEELQARYLTVLTKVRAYRANPTANLAAVDIGMSLSYERNRRIQAEFAVRRSSADEAELSQLKEQLKLVENVLRKNKKLPKDATQPLKAEGSAASKAAGDAQGEGRRGSLGGSSRSSSPRAVTGEAGGASGSAPDTAGGAWSKAEITYNEPKFAPGKPSLQSLRIHIPDQPNTLSATLLRKLQALLRDLGVPEKPVATRIICDGLDTVRRSAVALLSIQNMISKREKELQSLRSQPPVPASVVNIGNLLSSGNASVASKPPVTGSSSNNSSSSNTQAQTFPVTSAAVQSVVADTADVAQPLKRKADVLDDPEQQAGANVLPVEPASTVATAVAAPAVVKTEPPAEADSNGAPNKKAKRTVR